MQTAAPVAPKSGHLDPPAQNRSLASLQESLQAALVSGGVVITVRLGGQTTVTDPTLLQALEASGGGINDLARQAVAAYLNASNSALSYPFTKAQIVAWTRQAILTGSATTTKGVLTLKELADLFDQANNAGCTLGLNPGTAGPTQPPSTRTPTATRTPTP